MINNNAIFLLTIDWRDKGAIKNVDAWRKFWDHCDSNIFKYRVSRLSRSIVLSVSPLDSYFKIISGLDYDILRILVPQIIHVGGIDFDNRIASFQTGSFRRRTAVNLQQKQIDLHSCREKSGLTSCRRYIVSDYKYHFKVRFFQLFSKLTDG